MAAKGKYSKAIVDSICKMIEEGHTNKDAAILNRISHDTFYAWLKDKPEFSDAVKRAQAKFKKGLLGTIQKASVKSWQAAAWILERRHKDDYALRQEITGADGENLQTTTIVKNYDNKKAEKKFQTE